jgi:effector-binding domain-containing protein
MGTLKLALSFGARGYGRASGNIPGLSERTARGKNRPASRDCGAQLVCRGWLPGICLAFICTLAITVGAGSPAFAQAAPKPGGVEQAPLSPPTAAPAQVPGGAPPAAPQAQAPAPQAPSGGATAQGTDPANATLGPTPADPGTPDEIVVAPKPEAYMEGEAGWDDALKTIRETQKKVKEALDKAGVKIIGRPLARFVKTGDDKFSYEIGFPIELPAGTHPSLPPEVKLGTTPSGPAIRFSHHGSYDDIDGTYEAITIDLDAKGVEVNDAFLEEYVNDVADPSNPDLEVNIYVFKK